MFVPDGMGGERIEKRKPMNVSISYDHRVVDGHDAASFVQALKRLIEAPSLLLANSEIYYWRVDLTSEPGSAQRINASFARRGSFA